MTNAELMHSNRKADAILAEMRAKEALAPRFRYLDALKEIASRHGAVAAINHACLWSNNPAYTEDDARRWLYYHGALIS